jgi:aspartate carbamoyltransferase catalytic subunit
LIPPGLPEIFGSGVSVSTDLAEAIEGADVINVLRLQRERQQGDYFPTVREYTELFGLTNERLRGAKPDCLVLHPGPMNRGLEISSEVADGPRSQILDQVTNGIAVRMAVLHLFSGPEGLPAVPPEEKQTTKSVQTTFKVLS